MIENVKPEHQRIAEILTAVDELVEVAEGMDTTGPFNHFTCNEAEAFAAVITAAGEEDLAKRIILLHSLGDDDEDDEHHDLYLEFQAGRSL